MDGETKAEETVSLKKSTIWQIVSGVLGVLLVISIFTSGFGYGNSGVTGSAVVQQGNGNNQPSGNRNVLDTFKQYADDLKLDTKKFNDCLDSGKYKDEVSKDAKDAVDAGAQGTPATFINGKLVSGAQPYENFKQVIDEELKNPSLDSKISVDNDPFLGNKDAKVTIIEFSDFQCPFCGRFYQSAEKQIIDDYVKTGKARFVYRDFPLTSIHPYAQKAAEAGECANEQGKFWEYHDVLFENQIEWAS